MPVTLVEDTTVDLNLSEEENTDWEQLVVGLYDAGGAFMHCNPCGTCSCHGCTSCSGC